MTLLIFILLVIGAIVVVGGAVALVSVRRSRSARDDWLGELDDIRRSALTFDDDELLDGHGLPDEEVGAPDESGFLPSADETAAATDTGTDAATDTDTDTDTDTGTDAAADADVVADSATDSATDTRTDAATDEADSDSEAVTATDTDTDTGMGTGTGTDAAADADVVVDEPALTEAPAPTDQVEPEVEPEPEPDPEPGPKSDLESDSEPESAPDPEAEPARAVVEAPPASSDEAPKPDAIHLRGDRRFEEFHHGGVAVTRLEVGEATVARRETAFGGTILAIDLAEGSVWHRPAPGASVHVTLAVHTPAGWVSAHGANVLVTSEPDGWCYVMCLEGACTVESRLQGTTTRLEEGRVGRGRPDLAELQVAEALPETIDGDELISLHRAFDEELWNPPT